MTKGGRERQNKSEKKIRRRAERKKEIAREEKVEETSIRVTE